MPTKSNERQTTADIGFEQQDDGEPFSDKMARLTTELSSMFKLSHEFEGEIRERVRERLGAIGYEI